MARYFSYVFLCFLIIGCKSSEERALKRNNPPSWVKSTPVNIDYYVGVYSIQKTSSDYREKAKRGALENLASEISVNISAESVLKTLETGGDFNQEYEQNIRIKSSEEIEGYELVGVWEDENEYWVCYRLSKLKYAQIKKDRIEKALTLGKDYFRRSKENHDKNNYHDGITGSFNLAKDIKKHKFDKVFIFNSSLRFRLVCKIAGIKEIFQYPLFKKKEQHLIKTAQNFIKKELEVDVDSNPIINLDTSVIEDIKNKYNIKSNQTNVLLGIGGSGSTKRIPANKFLNFMKMSVKEYNCKFFLATGTNEEEQEILNEILNSEFKDRCIPLDKIKIKETLPIIKNCNISICNDSSFSHLSAALDIPTIVLLSDTPLMYGSYSPNMYPIIPDGEETVTHNTLGKERISPEKIFKIFKEILN